MTQDVQHRLRGAKPIGMDQRGAAHAEDMGMHLRGPGMSRHGIAVGVVAVEGDAPEAGVHTVRPRHHRVMEGQHLHRPAVGDRRDPAVEAGVRTVLTDVPESRLSGMKVKVVVTKGLFKEVLWTFAGVVRAVFDMGSNS
jgi:hypothetical protein